MNNRRLKGEIIAVFGTQEAFGKAMGWDKNKVSRITKGIYTPDVDEAAEIAITLKLTDSKYREIFLTKLSPNGDEKKKVG